MQSFLEMWWFCPSRTGLEELNANNAYCMFEEQNLTKAHPGFPAAFFYKLKPVPRWNWLPISLLGHHIQSQSPKQTTQYLLLKKSPVTIVQKSV
jgi:hypothetical protein